MAQGGPNVLVKVVVSGQSHEIKFNLHQKLEQLVREGLKKTGNEGQAPSEWELRQEDGLLLDQQARGQDIPIVSGVTLFLSPKAGAGGEN